MIKLKKLHAKASLVWGKQSGFALSLVILIAVVLVVAGGTGYYFYKTSQELEEIGEEVVDETADWKTYRNEKYGYSFKYPLECRYGPMLPYCKEGPPEERPPECLCFLNGENPDGV
ncbi:hypothetical protein L6250_01500, partial [Candidatus Parcubacteria bacterium]|nr:hypothetical protein [Candidatus Omnitrophota bacterium]MCG2688290.1 hypothetical protein [Candidatus Parcubacteria bacterium]